VRGGWWLPQKDSDTVAGELSFSERGIRLVLDGHFDIPEFRDPTTLFGSRYKAPIILGRTVDGESCMLLRSVISGFSGGSRSFAPRYLLISEGPLGDCEPQIAEVLVHYSHLEDWGSKQLVRTDRGAAPGTFNIVVPTNRVETLKVESDIGFQSLTLWTAVAQQFKPGEVHLAHRSHFEAVFHLPETIDSTTHFVGLLADLLTLLIGETAYVTKVRVIPKSEGAHPPIIDVFSSWVRGDSGPVRAPEMCCPLDRLSSEERAIFASWFKHAEELKPVYDLLLSTTRSAKTHLQMDFLNLIQALETFHRRVYGGQITSDQDYDAVRVVLRNAIPSGTAPELAEKLKSLLDYGNELSLKKRLTHLCRTLKRESVESLLGVSEDGVARFLQLLVDMRNFRTHYDEKLRSRVREISQDLVAAYNVNLRLRAFTTLLLLTHLGLEETKLATGLSSQLHLAF